MSCDRLRRRLVELGHEEVDFPMPFEDSEWDKIMKQPRDVTPRSKSFLHWMSVCSPTAVVWNSVRHKLEACIQRTKARRVDAERAA